MTTKFLSYVDSFQTANPGVKNRLNIKKYHSLRVLEEIKTIGYALKLNHYELGIAKIIALFHDIGRFEQYTKYGTFSDNDSVNHAELAVEIIEKNRFFDNIEDHVRQLIYDAILNHNRYFVPGGLNRDVDFHSKLIRDADKLDIFYIITESELYNGDFDKENDPVIYKVPDNIYNMFLSKSMVRVEDSKCNTDNDLLRLSWVFDISYLPTLQIINKRKYLNTLLNRIPPSKKLDEIKKIVINHVQSRVAGSIAI